MRNSRVAAATTERAVATGDGENSAADKEGVSAAAGGVCKSTPLLRWYDNRGFATRFQ